MGFLKTLTQSFSRSDDWACTPNNGCRPDTPCKPEYALCGPDYGVDCMPDCDPDDGSDDCDPYYP